MNLVESPSLVSEALATISFNATNACTRILDPTTRHALNSVARAQATHVFLSSDSSLASFPVSACPLRSECKIHALVLAEDFGKCHQACSSRLVIQRLWRGNLAVLHNHDPALGHVF